MKIQLLFHYTFPVLSGNLLHAEINKIKININIFDIHIPMLMIFLYQKIDETNF